MFGPLLRDFESEVSGVYNFLLYAADFVSKDQGIPPAGFPAKMVQFYRVDRLLHGNNRISIGL